MVVRWGQTILTERVKICLNHYQFLKILTYWFYCISLYLFLHMFRLSSPGNSTNSTLSAPMPTSPLYLRRQPKLPSRMDFQHTVYFVLHFCYIEEYGCSSLLFFAYTFYASTSAHGKWHGHCMSGKIKSFFLNLLTKKFLLEKRKECSQCILELQYSMVLFWGLVML